MEGKIDNLKQWAYKYASFFICRQKNSAQSSNFHFKIHKKKFRWNKITCLCDSTYLWDHHQWIENIEITQQTTQSNYNKIHVRVEVK